MLCRWIIRLRLQTTFALPCEPAQPLQHTEVRCRPNPTTAQISTGLPDSARPLFSAFMQFAFDKIHVKQYNIIIIQWFKPKSLYTPEKPKTTKTKPPKVNFEIWNTVARYLSPRTAIRDGFYCQPVIKVPNFLKLSFDPGLENLGFKKVLGFF